jgi:hypothetical protein
MQRTCLEKYQNESFMLVLQQVESLDLCREMETRRNTICKLFAAALAGEALPPRFPEAA